MAQLHRLREQLLHDGKITSAEVAVIRQAIEHDGQLDLADVRLLTELLSGAREVCTQFDELFFPALKRVLLEDGEVSPAEQYYLLKMLYADGHIRPNERRFLLELRDALSQVSPQFESMLATALAAPDRNWSID